MSKIVDKIKSVYEKFRSSVIFESHVEEGEVYVFEIRKEDVLFLIDLVKEKYEGKLPSTDDFEETESIFHMLKAAEKHIKENEEAVAL